jgi:hypothetical protein
MRGIAAFRTGAIPGGAAMPSYLRDPDVANYIRRVEAADANMLEPLIKAAIGNFVLGCKQDGIWNAIKASCILAGARTLNGALVPLVGTAPTNFNFVSGDYNRKTGLVGDGSTKYLNSNRANNADPRDNVHVSAYVSVLGSTNHSIAAGAGGLQTGLYNAGFRCRTSEFFLPVWSSGLAGVSRSVSTNFRVRLNKASVLVNASSAGVSDDNFVVFRQSTSGGFGNPRIAFYSIGESLDLALLDARVTDLINAFGDAIP